MAEPGRRSVDRCESCGAGLAVQCVSVRQIEWEIALREPPQATSAGGVPVKLPNKLAEFVGNCRESRDRPRRLSREGGIDRGLLAVGTVDTVLPHSPQGERRAAREQRRQ